MIRESKSLYSNGAPEFPKRMERRLPATLKVRVLGIDADGKAFNVPAETTEISLSGARIKGLSATLNKGDIIGVQSSGGKNRFMVCWIKPNRERTYEVGLRCVQQGACPWLDWVKLARGDDRRGEERYVCNGSVSLRSRSQKAPIWATLRDVSASGCYVQTVNTVEPGETLFGEFTVSNTQLNAVVEVRNGVAGVGMGLLWCDLGCDGKPKLTRVLNQLAADNLDSANGKTQAISRLNAVNELLVAFRERLNTGEHVVNPETISNLCEAEEKLTAALKSVQP